MKNIHDIGKNSNIHNFNPAVIYSYYNVEKYKILINTDYGIIKRFKDYKVFLKKGITALPELLLNKKIFFYSQNPLQNTGLTEVIHKEKVYDLDYIFNHTPELKKSQRKRVSRGLRLLENNPEITITKIDNIPDKEKDFILGLWEREKKQDSTVFQMMFDAKKYIRSINLKNKGFNTIQYLIKIKGKPFGIRVLGVDKDKAFDVTFILLTKFLDKFSENKINDLSILINIWILNDLHKNEKINIVNTGLTAGIKGLSNYKHKLPLTEVSWYQYS